MIEWLLGILHFIDDAVPNTPLVIITLCLSDAYQSGGIRK